MKHTQETWKYSKDFDAVICIRDHKVKAIADFGKIDLPETEANAKLIEAAPELLKATEHFKAYLLGENPMPHDMLLKFVETVIQKATN